MRLLHRSALRSLVPVLLAAAASAQGSSSPLVRVSKDESRSSPAVAPITLAPIATDHTTAALAATVCATLAVARYGDPAPGGGTLACVAPGHAGTRTDLDQTAFFSDVSGGTSNQGVFAAEKSAIARIAGGCGGGGGSGVPGNGCGTNSPIGGKFSGLFGGTFFAPGNNRNGDALFVADVDGGSSPRGLFLYRAASQTIVKVAAVGEASPAGGTLLEVGPGSMNDAQTVVFAARGSAAQNDLILQWQNGVLTKVAANGDAAPGGGSYSLLITESVGFADGTTIHVGPLPDINNAGQIGFRAITSIGTRGIVVVTAGVPAWYVQDNDPTPHGGTYLDMQAACLNDAGEVAFFADWRPTPTTINSGWFVGKPGAWRAALSFFDPVSTGQCFGLAFSRNPIQALDEQGNLAQWILIDFGGGNQKEAIVISAADGSLAIVAQQSNPSPLGGIYNGFDAWPSMTGLRGAFGAYTPGSGILNAYFQFELCAPTPVAYCTAKVNSLGCTPSIAATGTSSASSALGFTVAGSNLINNQNGILILSLAGRAAVPFGGGTLCLKGPVHRTPVQNSNGNPPPNDCSGVLGLDLNAYAAGAIGGNPPAALSIPGTTVDTQVWTRDPGFALPNNIGLTGGLEYVVGI